MSHRADLRRWVANQRAVNAHVRSERRALSPSDSLAKAQALSSFVLQAKRGPTGDSVADAKRVHKTWVRLRKKLLSPQDD